MKKITLILMLGIAVAAVAAVTPLSWNSTSLDMGEVTVGVATPVEFTFTNDGTEPVTILEAKGSCGCTAVTFPEDSIAPGESARVAARFTSSKEGVFKKNIRIKTTASEEYTYLYFSGEVVK